MTKKKVARRIIFCELLGFGVVLLVLWLDEILDFPHLFFGAAQTPINWVESSVESLIVLVLCATTTFFSWRLLQHIKYLEGFLPVCSFCKKIRLDDHWIPIEDFIASRSEAVFSHGLCPECSREHYPELFEPADIEQ